MLIQVVWVTIYCPGIIGIIHLREGSCVMCKRVLFYVCPFVLIGILYLLPIAAVAAAKKDTLIIGLRDDTITFDPVITQENVALSIMREVYERLVTYENFEDDKTWTIHLRKNVQFASGNPVTADDVVFSFRRAFILGTDNVPQSYQITQFGITKESISKIDDYTVQFVMDQQYAPGKFLAVLASGFTAILDQKTVMEHEVDSDIGSGWLKDHSAGSGPYVIESRKPGEQLVLKANPYYWQGKPIFERVLVKHIPESITQMALLQKGEIDIAMNLLPDQLNRLRNNRDIQIAESRSLMLIHVILNTAYEPFSRLDTRDAIRYAVDYDGIIKHVMQGAAIKMQTIIPKGILGYNPDLPYTHDVKKAKQLLAKGGYPDGFALELSCLETSPLIDIAMKLKNDLAAIGITVKIEQLLPDQLLDKVLARKFQAYLWSWESDFVDPDANVKSYADYDYKMLAWFAGYNNPKVIQLSKQASQELDVEKRKNLYRQISDIILHEGPYVILLAPLRQFGVRVEVMNLIGPPPPITSEFPTLR
jgi:peptide/nickel transport system substrate-binding protein